MSIMYDQRSRIGFIGGGKVGGALAVTMARAGHNIVGVSSRTFDSARLISERINNCETYHLLQELADHADIVFITTPDDSIASVVSEIRWNTGQAVIHCSGAASVSVLITAQQAGALTGAMHPLQALSSIDNGIDSIPGTTFGIEANGILKDYLSDIVYSIGGLPVFINAEDKAIYHLTGVLMGNLLTALGGVSAELWETFGFTRAEGIKALVPMMRQVSVNLEKSGLPDAIAGPYVRGDIGTVRNHLEALRERAPQYIPLYSELALAGLPFACERGPVTREIATQIEALLKSYNPSGS